MALINPIITTRRENYEDDLWVKKECYKYYVKQRMYYCKATELLDSWLLAPYCEECFCARPLFLESLPDISHDDWETDILLSLGRSELDQVKNALKENPEYAFYCKHCNNELKPWESDDIFIVRDHLEEHYGIPLTNPGHIQPSKEVRRQIISLYESKCFGCKSSEDSLHIDHIRPRTKGGDSAFRNLQPLCSRCGNEKSNIEATEIEMFSTIYFSPLPSDNHEGLFW